MKDLWIALLLAAIVALKLVDVIADTGLSLPVAHLAQEWTLLALSALGCVYLITDMRRRSRALRHLAETVRHRDADLEALGSQLREARHAYGQVIRQQFADWGLTRSEQEVAQLLLKGLSLREIAAVRDTREKTVRQHASSLYAKAGVEGRHALAAWFLEDFMPETADEPAEAGSGSQAASRPARVA
jgi:DNA-binding CsgD family transcriptional regulator